MELQVNTAESQSNWLGSRLITPFATTGKIVNQDPQNESHVSLNEEKKWSAIKPVEREKKETVVNTTDIQA